ncbi:MAG: cupin domain-containing protein [Anaerolineae bacterium]|nr:cupin domain-containing protein [Anaerolineae bacterium]
MSKTYFPDWRQEIEYGTDGPKPNFLMTSEKAKVILGGLEAGQRIPEHPEAEAVYHFLEGEGWMIVDGERLRVTAGTTITMPDGTVRGVEADTRVAFLAVRIA